MMRILRISDLPTAGMIVLTCRIARSEATRVYEHGVSAKKAGAIFIALIDRGFEAVSRLYLG
jgi:hypothetical protein